MMVRKWRMRMKIMAHGAARKIKRSQVGLSASVILVARIDATVTTDVEATQVVAQTLIMRKMLRMVIVDTLELMSTGQKIIARNTAKVVTLIAIIEIQVGVNLVGGLDRLKMAPLTDAAPLGPNKIAVIGAILATLRSRETRSMNFTRRRKERNSLRLKKLLQLSYKASMCTLSHEK